MQDEITTKGKVNKFSVFLKRTSILFVLLVVIFTFLGFAPRGVVELNNVFFSFFIKDENAERANIEEASKYTEPTRIVIPSLEADVPVLNPLSRDNSVLDSALLKGAVRYPGSGDLSSKSTMLVFGHSSYLPVVHNKAFQSFNNIQKLVKGDKIVLIGDGLTNTYEVETVEKVNAEDEFVDFSEKNGKLVLATCNSFGKKQERFVVTAFLVESK